MIAAGALLVGAGTSAARAQCYGTGPKPLRLVDLGPIGAAPLLQLPPFGDLTFGINDQGQAVFFGQETPGGSGSPIHLFVHMPRTLFNVPSGVSDLHPWLDPTLPSSFVNSAGTDINNAGKIVGLAGEVLDNSGYPVEAWLFELDQTTLSGTTPPMPEVPNESLHPGSLSVGGETEEAGCYSTAHGISSGSTPAVAGAVGRDICFGACDRVNPIIGFTLELGGSYVARAASGPSRQSYTFSVNDASPRVAVGRDDETYSTSVCSTSEIETGCTLEDYPSDALRWSGSGSSPTVLTELDTGGQDGVTQARDVHSDGSAVGSSAVPVTPGTACPPHAVWWSPSNVVTNLNSVYAAAESSTRAEAIREVGGTSDLRVVGGDIDLNRALLWLWRCGAWCADDLNDLTLNPSGSRADAPFQVVLAHDVNAHGHIIGHGFVPDEPVPHAFLLTCACDYDGDYLIDGADMGILLAAWGCSGCSEDLDGDGTVDGADLGLLIAAWHDWSPPAEWTPCHVAPPAPCEQSQSMDGEGAGGFSLDEALEALGFASGETFAEWSASATPAQRNNAGAALAMLIGGA